MRNSRKGHVLLVQKIPSISHHHQHSYPAPAKINRIMAIIVGHISIYTFLLLPSCIIPASAAYLDQQDDNLEMHNSNNMIHMLLGARHHEEEQLIRNRIEAILRAQEAQHYVKERADADDDDDYCGRRATKDEEEDDEEEDVEDLCLPICSRCPTTPTTTISTTTKPGPEVPVEPGGAARVRLGENPTNNVAAPTTVIGTVGGKTNAPGNGLASANIRLLAELLGSYHINKVGSYHINKGSSVVDLHQDEALLKKLTELKFHMNALRTQRKKNMALMRMRMEGMRHHANPPVPPLIGFNAPSLYRDVNFGRPNMMRAHPIPDSMVGPAALRRQQQSLSNYPSNSLTSILAGDPLQSMLPPMRHHVPPPFIFTPAKYPSRVGRDENSKEDHQLTKRPGAKSQLENNKKGRKEQIVCNITLADEKADTSTDRTEEPPVENETVKSTAAADTQKGADDDKTHQQSLEELRNTLIHDNPRRENLASGPDARDYKLIGSRRQQMRLRMMERLRMLQ